MKIDYAARARALVGTSFRPQGRGEGALDCVGVVLATYGLPSDAVRSDYRLRGNDRRDVEQALALHFRRVSSAQLRPGDVMLLAIAEEQLHFAVGTDAGFVHAHAGVRKVVETPGEPEWPLLGVYRKRRSC